jgi:Tfp pilus assembly protein PilN
LKPLNVATQPFRNERLPILLVGLLTLTTTGFTLAHAITLSRLMPSHLRQAEAQAGAIESDLDQLRAERKRLGELQPAKDDLAHWTLLRDLVDRRVFRWTELFARLGAIVPEGVRLTAIEPAFKTDAVELRLTATAAKGDSKALLALVGQIETQPDFDNATPESLNDGEKGSELVLRVRYRPTPEGVKPKPAPTASTSPEMRP